MVSDQICKQLHDLIFRFVRKQRFVGLKSGIPADQVTPGLGHTEQSVLFVLNATPGLNVKDLSEFVRLERSWMSRVVASLEERELVQSLVSASDRRAKKLSLTRTGEKLLQESEAVVQEMFTENLATLSRQEQGTFHSYLQKFANGLGAPDFEQHSGEEGVAYQLGRISAGFGMYGEQMFGTDLTVSQLHVLLVLQERRGKPVPLTDIDEELPMDTSTVSRIVQSFAKSGLITKERSERDKRSSFLELSQAGDQFLKKYYATTGKVFKEALRDFSNTEIDTFLELYEKVSRQIPYPIKNSLNGNIKLRELSDENAIAEAQSLVDRVGKRFSAPERARQLGLFTGETLTAVLSVERNKKDGSICSLSITSEGLRNDEVLDAIQSTLKLG